MATAARTGRPSRTVKLVALEDLAARVPDGCRIAFGGFPMFGKPMAAVRELVRRGSRELVVVGTSNGIEVDVLVAAGAVRRIETAYVGLEEFGLAPNYRRAAEAGAVEVVDYSEGVAFDRFRAGQEGLTFVPVAQLVGTDIAARNPEIVPFPCPLTGRPYHAVPAANVEVAVIHAPAADEFGNILYPQSRMLPQGLDLTMACAADVVLVTVERVVDSNFVLRNPQLTQIPAFRTTLVAHAPWGAHPTALPGFYEVDDEFMRDTYLPAATGADSFDGFLDDHVRGATHEAYLETVGAARLFHRERWAVIA
ncbi:CoA transferase [Pseudonocardia ailaonensis]|uniref:CoA transferase n=1 Tax=Pseudonocardia ailaonensis TaxID=367279 RepID=A0ABN2MZJ4_9PSEU